jgi:opacity protein-like surface antigen
MKRMLICVASIALVAFCATATATTSRYHGAAAKGGSVSFKAVVHHGKIKTVKDFRWKHIPLKCQEGTTRSSTGFSDTVRVHHGKFKVSGNNPSGNKFAEAKGLFQHHGKARGRLIVNGTFGTGSNRLHHCHVKGGTIRTGVRWDAH